MTRPVPPQLQRRTLLRFLAMTAAGNLLWEIAHMPLYTLWQTGTPSEIAFAIVHCTAGDILIAITTLTLAIFLTGWNGWPGQRYRRVAIMMILAALAFTVFSEWLNVEVRGAWAYRDLMPRLPWLGTGLTPILQWIIVPLAAFWWASPRDGPDAVA